MDSNLDEMNNEFLELQIKIAAAQSKLFSAQDVLHRAKGDVYSAMCDLAKLEQYREIAMREMEKAAQTR